MNTEDFDFEEIEQVHRDEVREEAEAIPEVEEAIAEEVSENREAYENLTQEGLRDVVNEILAEAEEAEAQPIRVDPRRTMLNAIDTAVIPVGMTAEQYISHYQTTGNLLTDTTGTSVTYTGSVTTSDSTNAITPTHNPLDDLFVNKEKTEDKKDIEEVIPTPEQIARIKAERKLYHEQQLKYKREIRVKDMTISKNDLIITFDNGTHTFYHLDLEGYHQMKEKPNPISTRRGTINGIKNTSNSFIFDKNMNRLILCKDNDNKNKTIRRDGTRIYKSQLYISSSDGIGIETRFVIVDKNIFLSSKGRLWKLKYKNHISYNRIKATKKMYMKQFDEIEQFMSFVKSSIEIVHPAEDYDIMYSLGGRDHHLTSDFVLLLKFNDVTISNSIELNHHIGDMIIKSAGYHYFNDNENEIHSTLHGSLSGTRLTFTPEDAGKNYQHSHLTTSMHNFGGFCTGSENYSNGDGYLTEHNIQEHIFRIDTFIRWESLEGGPHYRMENINAHGTIQPIKKNILGTGREVRDSYVERLIYEINQIPDKFNVFTHCFTLVNQRGTLKFVADYQMFFRKFMEVIPSEKIKQINTEVRERFYTYNSLEGSFHVINDMDMIDPIKVIQKAETHMRNFNPIYMNGKYHRPHLATRNIRNLLEGLTFSPEPNIMKEIAQLIMYHLTNKLEQYGNTSTNKREEG